MLVKKFKNQKEFVAGDNCLLRELLHGPNENLAMRYSLAWAKVSVGATTWKHSMKTSEVYFILNGKGRVCINDEITEVEKYDIIDIPPGAEQYIENIGEEELEFVCIVDPGWRKEDEVLLN
jgi:mannose-6-phosphate isomerase-like protein (cupin superfamily)